MLLQYPTSPSCLIPCTHAVPHQFRLRHRLALRHFSRRQEIAPNVVANSARVQHASFIRLGERG